MYKIFKNIGIIGMVLFSFFYTNKIIEINSGKDPIMNKIKEYKTNTNTCIKGVKTTDGIIPSISGKVVNTVKSYNNMRGIGYNEELLVFDINECEKEDLINNYIIKGNPYKNSVSIVLDFNDINILKKYIDILMKKNIKITIALNGKKFTNNKKYIDNLITLGYEIVYNGNDIDDFLIYKKNNVSNYCIKNNYDIIKICSKYQYKSINSEFKIEKNLYLNVKKNLNKGNIYVISANRYNMDEFSITLNYINNRGLKIKKLNDHLNDN